MVTVGDHRQLAPVGPGGALAALVRRHPDAVHHLVENRRQTDHRRDLDRWGQLAEQTSAAGGTTRDLQRYLARVRQNLDAPPRRHAPIPRRTSPPAVEPPTIESWGPDL